MKRKPYFHLVTAVILALGWLGFQSWQSVHRFQEHYLQSDNEGHGDCQMCEWEVPLVELSELLDLRFVVVANPGVRSSIVVIPYIDSFVSIPLGRGPPNLNAQRLF